MRLHPWPLGDSPPRAPRAVVWKSTFAGASGASALLIDSGAVPLSFAPESSSDEPAGALDEPTSAVNVLAALQCHHNAALARIRVLEALLRDFVTH